MTKKKKKMRDFTAEISHALDALLKLENETSDKKNLFDKERNVCLRISLFKIPKVNGIRKKYLKLKHSRFGDDPEICLFVPNRKSEYKYKITTDEMIDLTVDYFKTLLEKNKVEGIKMIMPLKQLTSEYGAYELRRKLVNRFDLFLCKNSLLYNQRFINALGKYFIKSNKEPLGISFPLFHAPHNPNFNESVKRAICSTWFRIKGFSDNYAIPFGTASQSKIQLEENLKMVIDQILTEDIIPGGLNNIKAFYLGSSKVGAVPLYICTELPNNLVVPRVKSRRKSIKKVKGEITTAPGKKLTVQPSGNVIVENLNTSNVLEFEDMDDGENFDEGSEEEMDNSSNANNDDDDKVAFGAKGNKDEKDESEDDEEIERREKRLLKQSRLFDSEKRKMNEDEEDEGPTKKQKKANEAVKSKKIKKNKSFAKKETSEKGNISKAKQKESKENSAKEIKGKGKTSVKLKEKKEKVNKFEKKITMKKKKLIISQTKRKTFEKSTETKKSKVKGRT